MAAGLPFRSHTGGRTFDVAVLGAGIIGLSIALELQRRGARVLVLERDVALAHASTAAAGMLAAEDPHNPAALLPLSRYSVALYTEYLIELEHLARMPVHFQTDTTLQHLADGTVLRLAEYSLDPRQLAVALRRAAGVAGIDLFESTGRWDATEVEAGFHLRNTSGNEWTARQLVHCSGAWFGGGQPVRPRKGQMLRVRTPAGMELREVHRSAAAYVVPRTKGPQAGSAVIGATLEDVGYDTTTSQLDLEELRRAAAELVPGLASEDEAPQLEAWAGLRPGTPDDLPLLGALPGRPRQFVAAGHFRNGILLAPATAKAMADLLEGQQPPVDLEAFAPGRFLGQVDE